jgi:serine/threonine protein kinase/WD40 repeat protein
VPSPAFKRVEEVFHQAVALAPAERPTFLNEACAGDADLRAAVEDLLRHDDGGKDTAGFLVSPLAQATEGLRPGGETVVDVGQVRPAAAAAALPQIFGYEILKERGRGGMGVVYEARQVGLNRVVALKMLLPECSAAPELLARFRTEAEALARLQHPNIVPIYDVGEWQGRPYFTMEYVAGPSLAEVLDGRAQDISASARLVEVLARTMHAVHQAGLIHRDLKPANVLLRTNLTPGRQDAKQDKDSEGDGDRPGPSFRLGAFAPLREVLPKITDFGLAKDQAEERKLTRSGMALGTPCYMAPEQARVRAGGVGPAADIYALGAILYEMLTGRPPFDAESQAETIVQVLNEEPLSPARLRPRLPRDLVTICLKCLEKAPRRRYATAQDLAEDLRRFQAGEPILARPVGLAERCYRWCRRRPSVAALLALSALLTVALVATVLDYQARLRAALATTEKRAEDERKELVQLNTDRGVVALEEEDTFTAVFYFTEALRQEKNEAAERNHRTRIATALRQAPKLLGMRRLEGPAIPDPPLVAAISPDRGSLAVVGNAGPVWVGEILAGKAHVQGPGGQATVRRLAFDPDGRLLLTEYAQGAMHLWDLTRSEAALLREFPVAGPTFAALSDDGRWLFTLDAGGRGEVSDVATGKAAAVPLKPGQGLKLSAVALGGRRVAVVGADNALVVWDVPAAAPVGPPIPLPQQVNRVVLGPDGERVVTTGNDGTAEVWQAPTGKLRATWSLPDSSITDAHFSPDGRLVLLGDDSGQARVWNAATGHAVTPPLRPGGSLVWAGFNDDGGRVVTVSRHSTVCAWQLPRAPEVTHGAAGGEGDAAEEAAVAQGGQPIKLGNGVTVARNRVTAGALRPPPPRGGLADGVAFSPDGLRVAVCDDANTVRVWDTARRTPLTPPLRHRGVILCGAFSPDGQRLLTASDNRTARVWDAGTGEVLAPPLRHDRAITRVFFRANGDRACVVQEGGGVTTWDLTADNRPIDQLVAQARVLAAARGGPTDP